MSRESVKKNLKKHTKEKLIDILMGVYDFNGGTKSYLENIFSPQPEKELEKCKEIIDYEFDPWESHRMDFERCRKFVSEFQKMNFPVKTVADLLLYLAEAEIHYSEYGDYYDDTYDKILEDFEAALEYIASNALSFEFEERILSCLKMKVYSDYFKNDLKDIAHQTCWKLFEEDEEDEEEEETDEGKSKKSYIDDYDDSEMAFD